jgi:hypothetical protein
MNEGRLCVWERNLNAKSYSNLVFTQTIFHSLGDKIDNYFFKKSKKKKNHCII